MKRREFIINSLITAGGAALLGGCSLSGKPDNDNDMQISRRSIDNMSIPLLGFGCMRLPLKNGQIDTVELDKMVAFAFKHGINYFDTAYMYMNGKSENIMGEALKKYDRKSYFLADKNPLMFLSSKEDVYKIFDEQLKKCQTDYFDFYLAHNINSATIDNYRNFDVYNQLLQKKNEGKIKKLGFSFHGDVEMLKTVVKEHKWDFCQLQLNYFDWENLQGEEMYETAKEAELPVIVMEPLRGGGLCKLTPAAAELLKEKCPNETPTSYALKWIAKKDNVLTVLSGMSNFTHIKENTATLSDFKPLSETEEDLSEKLVKIIKGKGEINCTGCKYCTEHCPKGINIPDTFALYNLYKLFGNKFEFKIGYQKLKESERPDKCISCGACKQFCPQGLDIPTLLKQVENEVNLI